MIPKIGYWTKRLVEARKDTDFEKVAKLTVSEAYLTGKKEAFREVLVGRKRARGKKKAFGKLLRKPD